MKIRWYTMPWNYLHMVYGIVLEECDVRYCAVGMWRTILAWWNVVYDVDLGERGVRYCFGELGRTIVPPDAMCYYNIVNILELCLLRFYMCVCVRKMCKHNIIIRLRCINATYYYKNMCSIYDHINCFTEACRSVSF